MKNFDKDFVYDKIERENRSSDIQRISRRNNRFFERIYQKLEDFLQRSFHKSLSIFF
jgi:hypothetical protein